MTRALKACGLFHYRKADMELDEITSEINRLSATQKLIIVQDIWDSIAQESNRLSMPEWQKKELSKRYARYKNGKTNLHDWQAVHDKLRAMHE